LIERSEDLSECCKHGNSCMLEFSGSVPEQFLFRNTLREAPWIELRVLNIRADETFGSSFQLHCQTAVTVKGNE